MPQHTGLSTAQKPTPRQNLNCLVFGTAVDGILGESCWVGSRDEAAYVYGAVASVRFTPTESYTGFDCPFAFLPDDPSLVRSSTSLIYTYDPETGQPTAYTGFGSFQSSGRPTVLSFDRLGADASVTPPPGGVVIESAAVVRDGVQGNIVLPLVSLLQEYQNTGTYAVGGCRVGSSWLPPEPASLVVSLKTRTGFTAGVTFQCAGTGDNTANDRYTSCAVTVSPTGLTLDPGTAGLPYQRLQYSYAGFSTWNALLDQITVDFQFGRTPIGILARPGRSSPDMLAVPGAAYIGDESPVTVTAAYVLPGYGEPDLTTAAAWANILEQEDLPLNEAEFLSFSGLTGQALAADIASALRICNVLDGLAYHSDESPDPVVILPWSLSPPASGTVYDPSPDIAAFQNLVASLDSRQTGRLFLFWGTMVQTGIPANLDGTFLLLPVAYAAAGAVLRETEKSDSEDQLAINVLHPRIQTMMATGVPEILISQAAETPSPGIPTSVPDPSVLEALRSNGLNPVTRSVGDSWRIHSPIVDGDGNPFFLVLLESAVRHAVQAVLDPYLGQPNTPSVRSAVQASLDSESQALTQDASAVGRQISSLTLTLQYDASAQISTLTVLTVAGRMSLYGETGSIVFQVRASL